MIPDPQTKPSFWTTANGARMEQAPGGNPYRIGWAPWHVGTGGGLSGGPQNAGVPTASLPPQSTQAQGQGMITDTFPGVNRNQFGAPYAGIRTPGYQPDYNSLLNSDAALMATRNNNKYALGVAAAQRDAALKALQYAYNGQNNPYSDMAQIQRSNDQATFQGEKALRARGAFNSGELPWQQEQIANQYGLARYGTGRDYANNVQQALAAYLGVAQQNAGNEAQAINEAATRMAQNPIYQPTQGYAQLIPDWQSRYGRPTYQDMMGGLYTTDQSGQPTQL